MVQNEKIKCMVLEPPFFAWSRSQLRELGLPDPEPPKKLAALTLKLQEQSQDLYFRHLDENKLKSASCDWFILCFTC